MRSQVLHNRHLRCAAVRRRRRVPIRRFPRRAGLAFVIAAATALAGAAGVSAEPQTLKDKRAQAQQVRGEIAQIDARLELAVEAYNGASYRLEQLQAEIAKNRRLLGVARRSFAAAQRTVQERLVALYMGGEESTLEVVLGASSLDDLLDRLDSANRISSQDARIVGQLKQARAKMVRRERTLERAERTQRKLVAERAAKKTEIEAQLAERQRLYQSVREEIERLEAAERERQRKLQEELRRREREQQRVLEAGGIDTTRYEGTISIPEGIGTSPGSSIGQRAVQIAMRYLGIPYLWGGASPSTGFDCSGLTMYVFAQLGVQLPHYAASQYTMGVAVSRDQLQPGDLVFFHGLGHMGMYIGNDQFIHAPHTGDVVKISSLSDPWYASTWVGARRVA